MEGVCAPLGAVEPSASFLGSSSRPLRNPEVDIVSILPLTAIALAAACTMAAASPADPSPTPQPSPHARGKTTAKALRSAVNLCNRAPLYEWPHEGGVPSPADGPGARLGERFQIQAGPRYTPDGRGYYETTIPLQTMSHGFYWVSEHCFNPS